MKTTDFTVFKERRKKLLEDIKKQYSETQKGVVILYADLERAKYRFRQNSSFYYLTGIEEPGVAICLYFDGREVLYVPNFGAERGKWVQESICFVCEGGEKQQENLMRIKVDEIKYLGDQCKGYYLGYFFNNTEHKALLEDLDGFIDKETIVCSFSEECHSSYFSQVYRFQKCMSVLASKEYTVFDIAKIVHDMRRTKSEDELTVIQKAVDITTKTHEYIARIISKGFFEHEVEAMISYSFLQFKASGCAFPTIVASGECGAILHYTGRDRKFKDGDLVIIDIGAEYKNYCADITRTYPVSGKFTQRQKEIYLAVLETQLYVSAIAKPGMYINNSEKEDESLHHLAVKELEKRGFAQYFIHGIGHFLGLDVHDVGNRTKPIQQGDVFTIEPGIYIPEEGIGIRIEDDFVITQDGCECLSADLVKHMHEIEELMRIK